MNAKHLSYLCCPKTGQKLNLLIVEEFQNQVISGSLFTDDRIYSYPIIRGIPRFVSDEHYSDSFGYEWNKFPKVQYEEENIGKPMEGHTERMFQLITGFKLEEINGKRFVEFGCGPGRFLDIVRKNGGIAVGIDLSIAVEAAYTNLGKDPDVLIVQGDIFSPPFPKDFFDGGYSIGVLHHTPDPEKGLFSLCSVVKKGGSIAISVYPKVGLYAARSTLWLRKTMLIIRKLCGHKIGYQIAILYSKLSALVLYPLIHLIGRIPVIGLRLVSLLTNNLCVVVSIPDCNWRILDTFDAITPEYASTHTSEEIKNWFLKAGCINLNQSVWGDTSWQAIRK